MLYAITTLVNFHHLEISGSHPQIVQELLFNAGCIHAVFSIEELHDVATSTANSPIIPAILWGVSLQFS